MAQALTEIGYAGFDADNHYYEALDAFTRYADPKMASRCVQWCDIGGRKYHLVADKVSHVVTNATFDPIAMPGAMHEYFRGNPEAKTSADFLREREPIPAYYRDRDARVALMDEQGLDKVWLFPTLGVLYEELLKHDIPAVCHTFTTFNRWLEDDWGCNFENRIFGVPYISLADLEHACQELEWALDHDARVVVVRPAAPTTIHGQLSPFDEHFDPFWARVNEAGITLAAHAGNTGYTSNGYADDDFMGPTKASRRPSWHGFLLERAAHDFFIGALLDKLFVRFPNIRLASVENGSAWVPNLVRRAKFLARRDPAYFRGQDPVEAFREHVWINPFFEDDSYEVVAIMGANRVIFGSDWPHVEGMPQPLDYAKEIKDLDDASKRLILRDNSEFLTTRRPA